MRGVFYETTLEGIVRKLPTLKYCKCGCLAKDMQVELTWGKFKDIYTCGYHSVFRGFGGKKEKLVQRRLKYRFNK